MRARKNKKGQGSDQSEKEQDNKSQKSDNSNQQVVDTDNSPKNIPVAKLPQKLKTKKIIINISDTQYPIIQEVAEDLGWTIQRFQGAGDWDIWWTDRQITPDTLFKMNLHQKINHFPGIYVLARKNLLGLNLMSMKDRFSSQYDFFPQTWSIPLQFSKFRNFFENAQKSKTNTYIVKPEAWSQGRGIFLTRQIQPIMTGHKYVVQRYLQNPLLIDDLKFDLRIYVLLAGTDPLRLYIYQQGLTRFATRKYEQPTNQNINMTFIHLTNYSLNKKNPQYIYNTSDQQMNVGHKRTLSSTYQYLNKKGYDVKKLKQQIQDVIVKTIIAGLPAISHQYQYCQPQEYQNNMCFHILGIDIMITNDMKPYLIEINHTPSFQTGTPLDYKVKKNLITDSLKLMRITSKNKKMLFEKAKLLVKNRVQTGKRQIVKGQRRLDLLREAQQKRDKQQQGLFGGFKKIFPIENQQRMQQYKMMILHAQQVHKQTAEARQKIIRQQQEKQKQKIRKRSQSQADTKQTKQIKLVHKNSLNTSNRPKQLKQLKQIPQIPIKIQKEKKQVIRQKQKYISQEKQTILERQKQSGDECLQGQVTNISQKRKSASKACSFRTKTRKNLYNPNNSNEFMLNYIVNSNPKRLSPTPNIDEPNQESFVNMKKLVDKKRKDMPSFDKEKEKQKIKQGAYIIPKMYNIIDCQDALRIEAQIVKKIIRDNDHSPFLSDSQKLKSINTYQAMYKKPKFPIC